MGFTPIARRVNFNTVIKAQHQAGRKSIIKPPMQPSIQACQDFRGFVRGLGERPLLAMVPAIQLHSKNGRVTFEPSCYEGTRTIAGCFWEFWEYSTHRRLV